MITVVYLVRHSKAKELKEKKYLSFLENNKNTPLSWEGKRLAKSLSNNKELENIDLLITSDYKRSIETSIYLSKNKSSYEINPSFGERIHGVNNLSEIPNDFEKKQLEDENYKLKNGESRKEVQDRMYNSLKEVIKNNEGKKIVIVTHATAITFLLDKWCSINKDYSITYKNKKIFNGEWRSCTTFRLIFDDNKLIDIDKLNSELRVMSFNLKHRIKEDILGLWRKRFKRIVNYIIKEEPEIIGTQELTRKGRRYLKRNLKQYKIVGKSRHSIIFTNEFNCVLIKKDFKILGHKTYSLSDKINRLGRKAKTDRFPRICTVVHLERDGIKYFVINTHMDNSSVENKKRLLGIFEMIINKYKKELEYIIITGDFNMTIDNNNLLEFSKNYLDPFKDNINTSFPAYPELKAIDHIFVDKRFTCSNSVIDDTSNTLGYCSDHYPLYCDIKIKE